MSVSVFQNSRCLCCFIQLTIRNPTSDVADGLWSDELVFKESLSPSELQVWLPAALHQRGLLQTAAPKTTSRGQETYDRLEHRHFKESLVRQSTTEKSTLKYYIFLLQILWLFWKYLVLEVFFSKNITKLNLKKIYKCN